MPAVPAASKVRIRAFEAAAYDRDDLAQLGEQGHCGEEQRGETLQLVCSLLNPHPSASIQHPDVADTPASHDCCSSHTGEQGRARRVLLLWSRTWSIVGTRARSTGCTGGSCSSIRARLATIRISTSSSRRAALNALRRARERCTIARARTSLLVGCWRRMDAIACKK